MLCRLIVATSLLVTGCSVEAEGPEETPSEENADQESAPGAPVLLRVDRSQERELVYVIEHENTTGAMGQEGSYAIQMQTRCKGGASVGEAVFEAVSMSRTGGGQQIGFDSRNPGASGAKDEPAREVVEGILGKKVTFDFDAAGRAVSLVGAKELMTPAAVQLQALINREGLERSLNRILAPSPERKPLAVGDGWTVERPNKLTPKSTMNLTFVYSVTEVTAGAVKIAISGSAKMKHEGSTEGLPRPEVGAAVMRGRMEWNRAVGALETYRLTLNMEIRGMVPGQNEAVLTVKQVASTTRVP